MEIANQPELVSILIPVYNSPDLFLSLDSVLYQNYPNIEIIMIDDASYCFEKKKVENYIRNNNRGNITYFCIECNEKNLGIVKTMNIATQKARGRYLFSLAGDDCFYDDCVISDWVLEFQKTGAKVITAKRQNYDEYLQTKGEIFPTKLQAWYLKKLNSNELFRKIATENFILGSCTARDAKVVAEYGYFDERYRMIDDLPFLLKFLRHGERIHFFDRCVIKYRGGGISSICVWNESYIIESDFLFKNEVLPFVDDSNYFIKRYEEWKKRKRWLYEYKQEIRQKKVIERFCSILKYRAKMPGYTVRRIFEKYIMERIL